MTQEKIYRSLGTVEVEGRTISGYAVVFNKDSQDFGGIVERIMPGAITEDTLKSSDIFALFNHEENKVLARSRYGKGSLDLELRADGLFYSFEAPNTQTGDELIEHLKRGNIFGSSFGFYLVWDRDHMTEYQDGDIVRRDIYKIEGLFDISPVFEPAYLDTNCTVRNQELAKKQEEINQKMNKLLSELSELEAN